MYVGMRETAGAAEDLRLPYVCPSCHFSAQAEVIGQGEGLAHAPYGLGMDSLSGRAAGNAMAAAMADGREMVQLFPCPSCGTRQRGALGQVVTRATIVSLLIACVTAPLAYVAALLAADKNGITGEVSTTGPTIVALTVAVVVTALGTWRGVKKKLDRSRLVVTLHPDGSAPPTA